MTTLRLHQTARDGDRYTVAITLDRPGRSRRMANVTFPFTLSDQEQEELRWYFEEYLEHPLDPAPLIAKRIEGEMKAVGTRLFEALFKGNEDVRKLWNKVSDRLDDTRVEVVTGVAGAVALPWELLFDPYTDAYVALQARTFVRAYEGAVREPDLFAPGERLRILLAISRPGGRRDVPFRSVAMRIVKALTDEARRAFQLDVLRPPTYERLAEVLRAARQRGEPYHVVHFDGHGAFLDVGQMFKKWEKQAEEQEWMAWLMAELDFDPERFSPRLIYPDAVRAGRRGYLAFENPDSAHNLRLVGGPALGKLLAEADVATLVLNACRSSYAEPAAAPEEATDGDAHSQVRAFGSLAQEVMDEGVPGAVAMRYNVYVVTAAQFVADLYTELARGRTLGEAVTSGRKQLAAQPLRTIAYDPVPLQDWPVPVVYEAAPIPLFPEPAGDGGLHITVDAGEATPGRGTVDEDVPPPPDAGFYGRDETLLALDRAFDRERVVLLHGYAGSGKTTAAAEFARWYALTGGVEGPVLFTSFAQYVPPARVLDKFGALFGPALAQSGIHWLALDDGARRQVALQVMEQVPVLWIWDNVEPVAGFPGGTESAWTEAEQRELAGFLRAARGTQAKFLLTSRRDERGWLGDLPARVAVPPMPFQERVQLARALAAKRNRRLAEVEDWRPLLRFTQGNPLAITVLVGQALRDGLATKAEIEAFVAALRRGEAEIDDEESQGRSKSLAASLGYGFEHAFAEAERRQLALLHFFQGFVNVQVLRVMGNQEREWGLPALDGFTDEYGVRLLDRAADVGLLAALGGGYYRIHPALPWYFKQLYDQYYGPPPPADAAGAGAPIPHSELRTPHSPPRAFVEAMGELGNYYAAKYERGNRDVIGALRAEEANLLHARRLARQHGWYWRITSTMQGLRTLYGHTGRRAEWQRLVAEIVPEFVDPETDGPLPGREEQWSLVTQYRVHLAQEARDWAEAERLQRVCVEWDRERAAPALAARPGDLDDAGRNAIRTLAMSLGELGQIQREQGEAACVDAYEEAADLLQRIGDRPAEAVAAFNLGHAYKDLPAVRDLAEAERWYRRSLDLFAEGDRLGRGKCHNQLGLVAYERFLEARETGAPEEELRAHLNDALGTYHEALELLPAGAVDDLAVTHNQLGVIYKNAGDVDRALPHYRESIRYHESAGNYYAAAQTRFNVALALAQRGRFQDARAYAQAALRNFQRYGNRAADKIQKTQQLLAAIEQDMPS